MDVGNQTSRIQLRTEFKIDDDLGLVFMDALHPLLGGLKLLIQK